MEKEISQLDQVLIDTITKVSNVSGEIYDGAKKVTGQAIDIAMQQAPDIVNQLLMWKFAENATWFLFAILLIVLCIKSTKKYWDESDGAIILATGSLTIMGSVVFVLSLLEMIKIMIAPKIYLIEYAANLLKGN